MSVRISKSTMIIGEITNSAEYRTDEQNQNLPIFEVKFWFSKLKTIPKISQILQFLKSSNFHYRQTRKIIKFMKLLNFKNYQI